MSQSRDTKGHSLSHRLRASTDAMSSSPRSEARKTGADTRAIESKWMSHALRRVRYRMTRRDYHLGICGRRQENPV